ncbi:hypothetical protein F5888DRAFT_1274580 [Russula emetica]|nr:hypothetical protein F5888DRAFT_1274580 [Russula emetica]
MFNDHIYPPAKDYMSQPLYVRQPCSLQIIQLVECSPPPPQQQQQQQRQKYSPSRLSSPSSSYSDSESDSDGSAYDSSSSSLSAGSSYCSSAEDSAAAPVPPSFDNRDPSVDDTYHTRQRRVSLWRDAIYSKDIPIPSPSSSASARPASPSQKRKLPDGDLANNDSVTSHTPPRKSTRSTPSAHSCPACDEDFSSPLSLRQHASTSRNANEACRIAVEYGFE